MTLDDLLREVERWSGGGTTNREHAERLIRAAYEAGKRDGAAETRLQYRENVERTQQLIGKILGR
jgi:hypothetical protein